MAKVVFYCDGCGRFEDGYFMHGNTYKPADWFQRSDEDGTQIACSRYCIKVAAEKSGKTAIAIPL